MSGIIQTIAGINSPLLQGEATAQSAEANAAMAERQIINSVMNYQQQQKLTSLQVKTQRKETNAEIALLREKNAELLALNRANAGTDGIDLSGSDLLVQLENAENAEFNALELWRSGRNQEKLIKYQGDLAAYEHLQGAIGAEMQRRSYQQQATMARKGAIYGAIGGGLQGLSSGVQKDISIIGSF